MIGNSSVYVGLGAVSVCVCVSVHICVSVCVCVCVCVCVMCTLTESVVGCVWAVFFRVSVCLRHPSTTPPPPKSTISSKLSALSFIFLAIRSATYPNNNDNYNNNTPLSTFYLFFCPDLAVTRGGGGVSLSIITPLPILSLICVCCACMW